MYKRQLLRAQIARADAELSAPCDPAAAAEAARGRRTAAASADAARAAAQAVMATAEADLRHAREIESAARTHLARLDDAGADGACPTCERPLGEHGARLRARLAREADAAAARAETLARALREATAQQARLARDAQAAQRLASEADAAATTMAALAARREATQQARAQQAARLVALEARAQALAAALPAPGALAAATAAVRAAEVRLRERDRLAALVEAAGSAARDLATIKSDTEHAQAACAALDAEREALAPELARLVAAQAAVDGARTTLASADAALAACAAERAGHAAREEAFKAERERDQAARARVADLTADLVHLEALAGDRASGLLAEFRTALVSRLVPFLSAAASVVFQELTDARYQGLELDEDYGLHVLDAGQRLPLERFSGGEADLANLALRLALSQALAHRAGLESIQFLVLDEVFGSLDRGRRAATLQALGRLRGRFRQIWLITHVEDVKEAVDHVLEVEDDGSRGARLTAPRQEEGKLRTFPTP